MRVQHLKWLKQLLLSWGIITLHNATGNHRLDGHRQLQGEVTSPADLERSVGAVVHNRNRHSLQDFFSSSNLGFTRPASISSLVQ